MSDYKGKIVLVNLMVRLLKQNYTCESDGMITKWIFTCESENKTLTVLEVKTQL